MIVQVHLFAAARQLAESETVDVELPEGATVRDLRAALVEQHPALASIAGHLMIAVNHDYVGLDFIVLPNAEVAAIPPVSGG